MNVLMFHSIGNDSSDWYRRWLSAKLTHFEQFCKYLDKKGYKTLLLDEWYYLQDHPKEQTGREIVLTFDDGYLDNWVYAYPILKKYGLRGSIFINPEFVDPFDGSRPNLFDVWDGKVDKKELKSLGFLSWPEIVKMDAEGVIQAQSHSMSHNFYFNGEQLIDFYFTQPKYDWLWWFLNPQMKPFSLSEDETKHIPIGYPIFENYRALGLRRFFPNKDFTQLLCDEAIILRNQSKPNEEIKQHLRDLSNDYYTQNNAFGRFETDEEVEKRYRYELFESKQILEQKLNHPIEYLCWPGGGYNELSIKLSIEAGYKASTLASRESGAGIDNSSAYKRIPRIGTGSFIHTKKGYLPINNTNHLVYTFRARNGNLTLRVLLKIRKTVIQWLNQG